MTSVASIWSEVAIAAQREMLEDLNRQLSRYHTAVLQLMAVAGRAGAPIDEIVEAVRLCTDGPVPVEELPHDGETEPMEKDDPREIEAIRAADHIPTQELRAVTDEDLEAVS
jgi:hypothetical protein